LGHPNKAKYLFKHSDLVYATSKAIEREAKKYTPEDRVAYIPPSVDTEFFTPKKPTPKDLHSDLTVPGWIGNAEDHLTDIQILSNKLKD